MWRFDRLWNKACEDVIKQEQQLLLDIYNMYAKAINPGEQRVLRLNQFIEIVVKSNVIDDNFGEREIGPLFGLSMMTQVDEIYSTRHINMQFIEFVEAVARVAERVY